MKSVVLWVFLFLVDTIFWGLSQLEFSLKLHQQRNLLLGKIVDMLFYVPFGVAFFIGYFKGKDVFWKLGLVALLAATVAAFIAVWDINRQVEGGWEYYGSWPGIIGFVLGVAVATAVFAFCGGWLRDFLWRKNH